MDTSPKWILITRSQYYPLMPVWLYSGETSCYDDEVGHKEGHQTLRRAFSVAGPMFLTTMRCTNPRTLSLFSLCIGRVKRRNNYPQKFSFQGSSQVTQRVISKGDICTFNTSNQEEKHNTMKRKKTQWGEKTHKAMRRNDRTEYTETNIDQWTCGPTAAAPEVLAS